MHEVELAIAELKRLLAENQRQIRLVENTTRPDTFRLHLLDTTRGRLHEKLRLIQRLRDDVKELESITSLKMTTRYAQYQQERQANRRELHRVRRQLKEITARYQPREKPKPRFATV